MQPSPNDQAAPRETAAGLTRGSKTPPPTSGSPLRTPQQDEPHPTTHASGRHVTADKWNQ
jgi:hypothetical protein